ncbi:GntR family transcriptional regulator [Nocardiopsis sp. N85]|uniref:GntR family transcriptional regulator n=1 Tax=Nocardiopsis sp. N85 TaxID=3029400 RepID=UPI00237F0549|nr:GntR family transcriptional regulator [Nocardiopsis sp. N85]MDE3725005.1 GntR family transcriptional regulator [Nocardiopsis sp. N85]
MTGEKAYERIAEDLRGRIRSGEPAPGDRLPSEAALGERYGEGPPTVRRALGLLLGEGLIERRPEGGDVVREPGSRVRRSNDRHQWEKNRVRADLEERLSTGAIERDTGLDVDDLVFSATYERVKADAVLAGVFGLAEGDDLLERRYRTRHKDGRFPFELVRSYLVVGLIEENPDLFDQAAEPWPGGTQSQLDSVGIELDRVVERVISRPPTVEEAGELGLSAGVAVMDVRKTSIDTLGRVVEWSEIVLSGDRTEAVFTTRLDRW